MTEGRQMAPGYNSGGTERPRIGRPPVPVEDRIWGRVDKSGDCWIWTGTKTAGGYGVIAKDGKRTYTHRVVWELTRGEIPVGSVIDHLCRNTLCCNPDHLEPVPHRENIRRAVWSVMERTHCPHGHEMTTENTVINKRRDKTFRTCLICKRAAGREYMRRRRAAERASQTHDQIVPKNVR